jgi:nucleoside-diphosphate-sugar epimerase
MGVSNKKILIVGASGLVGFEAVRHFQSLPDWDVVAVSRRKPGGLTSAVHVSVDLTDRAKCVEIFSAMSDVTHVMYAAVFELPGDVVAGWKAKEQMQTNLAMIQNLFDPLEEAAKGLQHVTLLQGTKAYGIHIQPMPVPARERWPRHNHENFYWLQQDYLADKQQGKAWNWTILRPQLVFGEAIKGNLNVMPAMGVFAAVEREAGRPLSYPGGPQLVFEATDTELLASAMEWAATTPKCGGEIFNIANGDVMTLANLWPTLADCFGMEVGPPNELFLSEELPKRQDEWAAIVDKYDLVAPKSIAEFVGDSAELTDFSMATGMTRPPPVVVVSTIKARQFGFHDCLDTEDMLRKWMKRYQDAKLLPS